MPSFHCKSIAEVVSQTDSSVKNVNDGGGNSFNGETAYNKTMTEITYTLPCNASEATLKDLQIYLE